MGFNRGGRNNKRGKGDGPTYVYSSSLTQNICEGRDKSPIKVADELQEGESREINFTLTAEKTEQLLDVINTAMEDPNGDGGVRISMYIKEGENEKTGEIFDSLSLMVLGKYPNENKGRGSRGGSFRGKGGGGRRDYSSNNSGGRGRSRDQDEEREERTSSRRGRSDDSTTESRKAKGRKAREEEYENEEEGADESEEEEETTPPPKRGKSKASAPDSRQSRGTKSKGKAKTDDDENDDDIPY